MARVKKGVFSWEDVLAQRYQDNKPPPLTHRSPPSLPHIQQSQSQSQFQFQLQFQFQPQCALLGRLSIELRLIIWEMALGGHRIHIIQRSGQRLGHLICPLGLAHEAEPETGRDSGCRPKLDPAQKFKIARGAGYSYCEICQGMGIAQPVKEGEMSALGPGCAGRDGLLGLALTCRQISTECIPLLYATNTFEFSNPWSLPYLQPTIPPEHWQCIRSVELRWSFRGHWLPTKVPVRAIYVSAGRAQWLETCRAIKSLPGLRSFVLVLGSRWFSESAEKLLIFLEPLRGLHIDPGRCRKGHGGRASMVEWKSISEDETSSDESRASFESSSRSGSGGEDCSCFDPGFMGARSIAKGDVAPHAEGQSATWELRLQAQSYYTHEVTQIGDGLRRKGIACRISTV